jgi:predicted DNA-binding transcriptional regulator YafY
MKTDRLLAITLYLINRKKVTARELSDHFEVSLRTIQRDMESLAMAGIPLYADRGKDGGYRIIDSYTVNRHYFAPRELSALASLVGRLNALLGHSPFIKTEEKLLNLFNPSDQERKHDTLIMDFTPWGMDESRKLIFQSIYKAVENSQVTVIRYAALDGVITDRSIEPLSVIIKGSSWYVHSYCRLRKNLRLFKLSRIISTDVHPEYFNPNVHLPYDDTLIHHDDQRPTTLFVLRFSPKAKGRITDYYNQDRLQFMPDGSIMGFFPFPEDEWVYSWIMSFGPLVEVLEPPHARKRIKECVRNLSTIYDNL